MVKLTANESGGTSPYAYAWSGTAQTTKTVNGLTLAHTVTVTDANGCIATDNVLLTPTTPLIVIGATWRLTLNVLEKTLVLTIVAAIGGVAPITYTWSNGFVGINNQNLLAGSYTVTIEDANQCFETRTVSVGQPLTKVDPVFLKQMKLVIILKWFCHFYPNWRYWKYLHV